VFTVFITNKGRVVSEFFYFLSVALFFASFPVAFGAGIGAMIAAIVASLICTIVGVFFNCLEGK